jgi:outer membrane protein assembly factor BamC
MFHRRSRLAGVLLRSRLAGVLLAAMFLAACSSIRSFMDPGNVEYRSASQGPALDVPPDLVTPQGNDRYTLPQRNQPGQTLSEFNRNRAAAGDASPRSSDVMPVREGAKIERDGNIHWIVVKEPVEEVFPQLRDFWATQGFDLAMDAPKLGIMETEWAERRQKVETSGLRGLLSRALGSSYSTGERDRYRTRLERAPDGSTEIYVTHRGMEEVVTGIQRDQSVWQPRETDPELEIEYLRRILVQFGTPRDSIKVAGAASPGGDAAGSAQSARSAPGSGPDQTRVVEEGEVSRLEIDEGFDRAWREVGLVLDRVGFTVEDRDRSKGTFYVRYVDLERRDPSQGAISRFFAGERKDLAGQRYQLVVAGAGGKSTIDVREADGTMPGSPENQRVANRIIALLHEEMK